jgi:hypothetical protein
MRAAIITDFSHFNSFCQVIFNNRSHIVEIDIPDWKFIIIGLKDELSLAVVRADRREVSVHSHRVDFGNYVRVLSSV